MAATIHRNESSPDAMMTTAGHLEVLRHMAFRILAVVVILAAIIFCFKKQTFDILLAPHTSNFITFDLIEDFLGKIGISFHFEPYNIKLISTDLSAQFMTHITTAVCLALVLASPFIVFELFRFILPALYDNERKHSVAIAVTIYGLFIIGMLMSYFILFPISFRFLATYQVDDSIQNTITLDSYISTFTTLTFMMGCVFQLPIITFILSKMGLITRQTLRRYRRWAIVIILIIAAIITPPDLFTLFLVAVPMYGLYELSILLIKKQ